MAGHHEFYARGPHLVFRCTHPRLRDESCTSSRSLSASARSRSGRTSGAPWRKSPSTPRWGKALLAPTASRVLVVVCTKRWQVLRTSASEIQRSHSYHWHALVVAVRPDAESRPVVVQEWVEAERLRPVEADSNRRQLGLYQTALLPRSVVGLPVLLPVACPAPTQKCLRLVIQLVEGTSSCSGDRI